MPIRFRCPHCNRLLGIATRKAGTDIACPQCGVQVTVPRPAGGSPAIPDLEEIDEILGLTPGTNGVSHPEPATPVVAAPPRPRVEPAQPRAAVAPPPPPKPAPPAPAKKKRPADSLFETGDVDELLGLPPELPLAVEEAAPPPRKGVPKPVTGMDVQSLDAGDGTWVVSPQRAALLVVAVALLLLVAFGGGFLIASLL
jgi:DNA-directed RNA polymerase subunit RPC12/RpoP